MLNGATGQQDFLEAMPSTIDMNYYQCKTLSSDGLEMWQ
jgi:hypothetical protein